MHYNVLADKHPVQISLESTPTISIYSLVLVLLPPTFALPNRTEAGNEENTKKLSSKFLLPN